MRMDQIAYYCATNSAEWKLKQYLNLANAEWIEDIVTARSTVFGKPPEVNVARLQFCYALGIELEIIRYLDGPHWHQNDLIDAPFISHIGIHLDDGEEFPPMIGARLVQETFTQSHTSAYLTTGAGAGRKYHYKIFQIAKNYIKYIRRINP